MRTSFIRLLCGLVMYLATVAVQADVVAVVSIKSSVTSLSKSQVADIFLGRTSRYPDGTPALPIDQEEGSTERDAFYAAFASKSPAQLKAHWSKIIFTGRGKPPGSVANSVVALKRIAADSRIVSYIDRSEVDSSVRILTER